MEIHLGDTIKRLRKGKNMSQEQLADLLNITPQAVSRWETNLSYPDMALIPVIANYFDVSLDTLFGVDTAKQAEKIDRIIKEANSYFWHDAEQAERILKTALKDYPRNQKLLCNLLTLYECHMREDGTLEKYKNAIEIAEQLISEADDIFVVCSAKADLASIYQMNHQYEKAKEVIDSLPYMYPYVLNDKMRCSAYILKGEDRLKEAKEWKIIEIQELYIACLQEGEGYFEIGRYEEALQSFQQYQKVIELFMKSEKICEESYLWSGMQTHHWCAYVAQAGCMYKMGMIEKTKELIAKAYEIVLHAWGEVTEECLVSFRKCCEKYGLEQL